MDKVLFILLMAISLGLICGIIGYAVAKFHHSLEK